MKKKDSVVAEMEWGNRSFFAGSVLFVACLLWFYLFDLGFPARLDHELAESLMSAMRSAGGSVYEPGTHDYIAPVYAHMLYEVRILMLCAFVLLASIVYHFIHSEDVVDFDGAERTVSTYEDKMRRPSIFAFPFIYMFLGAYFYFSWRLMCFFNPSCDAKDRSFESPVFYFASFILIASGPYFVRVVLRMMLGRRLVA